MPAPSAPASRRKLPRQFVKEIVRPGTYYVSTPDGGRRQEEVTPDRIKKLVENANKMIGLGMKIPAPLEHQKDAKPFDPKTKPKIKHNIGYWSNFWADKDGTLYGVLDVPNLKNAKKVGKDAQEVSLYSDKYVDGLGNKYDEALLHVALVTHPIMPNQENFKPYEPTAMSLCMSNLVMAKDDIPNPSGQIKDSGRTPVSASNPNVRDVLSVLAKVGLKLPEDTNIDNLMERIVVAGTAVAGDDDDTDENGQKVTGKEQPAPIVMSQGEPQVSKELIFATNLAKKSYQSRIQALKAAGKINDALIEQKLNPLLGGFQMSINDKGEAEPNSLDLLLDTLEAMPSPSPDLLKTLTSGQQPSGTQMSHTMGGAQLETRPVEGEEKVDEESAAKICDMVFQNVGLKGHRRRSA